MAPTETQDASEGERPMTAGTSTRALRKIKEELKCSVCLELLTDPRLLPCHHSFCLRCLQGLQQHSPYVIRCPNCTEEFGIRGRVSELPRDFRANSLLDCFPAVRPESSNTVVSQPDPPSSTETFLGRITCSVCYNIYDEPRQLQCGHTFCTECLEFMEPHNGCLIHCPSCQGQTDVSAGIRALPMDRAKVEYIEAISERAQQEPTPTSSPVPPSSLLASRSVQPARISSSQSVHSEVQAPVTYREEIQVLDPESQRSSRHGSGSSVINQSASRRQPANNQSTPRRHPRSNNADNQSTPRIQPRSGNQSTPRRQERSGNSGNQSTPRRNSENQSASGRVARSENQSTPRRQPRSGNNNNQSTPRGQPRSGNNNNQSTPSGQPRSGNNNNQSTPRRQPRSDNNNNQSTPRRYRGSLNQSTSGSQSASRNQHEADSESQSDSNIQQRSGNPVSQSTLAVQDSRSATRNPRPENPDSASAADRQEWPDNYGSQSAPTDYYRADDHDGQTASAFRPDTPDTPVRRHYRSEETDGESVFDRYRRGQEDSESPLPSRTFWQMPTMPTAPFENHHESPLSQLIQNGYRIPNRRMPLDSDDSDSPSSSPMGGYAEGSYAAPFEDTCPRYRNSIARLMAGVMAHQRLADYRSRFLGLRYHLGQSTHLSSERPVYENPQSDWFWRH